MAHFNQQRGDNSGEYNNNKGNVRERGERDDRDSRPQQEPQQQQQQQQQEFVVPSLCIPRTHANIRRERVFAVFRALGLGFIGRIDVVEKIDEQTGAPFIRVFIHFTKWFRNDQTRRFLDHLETQKSANIVYDEPWYWKVTKSFVPAPQQPQQQQQPQPSRFPKPRIDLVGPPPPPTTVVSVSKPKTPSGASTSTDAATTAVSGKGKEVAKRMGYESGKGLGKKADGRLVPVQIKKNVGKNGIGFGAAAAAGSAVADADASADDIPSSEYWTKVAEATAAVTTATATRLSVSISPPPKIERRLFCDKDDVVASVASAPAKAASSHDASIAAEAIWKAAAHSKST
jgi:hypothetical protein